MNPLRSEQHFTTAGERDGTLRAALQTETTADLEMAYVAEVSSPHWAHPVFGGNARAWIGHLAGELKRRGVEQIEVRDCLGTRVVKVR